MIKPQEKQERALTLMMNLGSANFNFQFFVGEGSVVTLDVRALKGTPTVSQVFYSRLYIYYISLQCHRFAFRLDPLRLLMTLLRSQFITNQHRPQGFSLESGWDGCRFHLQGKSPGYGVD